MITRITVLLFSLLTMPAMCQAQQEFFPFVGQLTEDSINIRAGQSINFEKLGKLKQDEQVVVVDKSYSWYKIRLPLHARSFISSEFVTPISTTVGEISGKRVNVRGGAGLNFSVLGQMSKGDRVSIIKNINEEWVQIRPVADTHGWVSEKFIKFVSSDVSEFIPPESPQIELLELSELDEALDPVPEIVDTVYISDIETYDAVEEVVDQVVAPQTEFYGVLTERSDSADGFQYLLIEEGVGTFNLDGYSQLLTPFLNYRVKIEGYIKDEAEAEIRAYPVVVVKRIQLVL